MREIIKYNKIIYIINNNIVIKNNLHILKNWNRNYTIETILISLRQEMLSSANKRLPQPNEGEVYSNN
ncbi:hypothetical protein PFMALIP_00456 [Plasmodium falciparum MaliPS096_E11]|uniref:UBC core domain-containing protein n=1 Tax=Plasmodium falciparum MaliPS096_E11 TaxID=1036727 RepID=A0A024WXM2_PLAFA|nr:hypothetical protein PFMALIP_00456 [Plasmodium falciparum MaliPS096_E11]